MELIVKVSKGSKMDQVYLPRMRNGFPPGSYVLIKPLESPQTSHAYEKPYFYGLQEIEPAKLGIMQEIFKVVAHDVHTYENIFIMGSFLEKGFLFNDVDVLVISDAHPDEKKLKEAIEGKTKINIHLIIMGNGALLKGLATDPLYLMMLSKAIAKKRFIYPVERKIDYQLLDLHLLKSKSLLDNFDALNGNEKYYLVRNMVAILEFIKNKKLRKESVDRAIEKIFHLRSVQQMQLNMLPKKKFLQRFKKVYQGISHLLMEGIRHDSKPK